MPKTPIECATKGTIDDSPCRNARLDWIIAGAESGPILREAQSYAKRRKGCGGYELRTR